MRERKGRGGREREKREESCVWWESGVWRLQGGGVMYPLEYLQM